MQYGIPTGRSWQGYRWLGTFGSREITQRTGREELNAVTVIDASQHAAPPPPRRSRAEQVYEDLRSQIVNGTLRPNQRLIEVEVAGQFAVSRTPVRESLQRLAAEGLVTPVRRGWAVKERTLEEIREIYEVREALEGYAARLAAERIEPEQLALVTRIAEERERVARIPANRQLLVSSNDRFHAEIFKACGNARLIERIERNLDYYYNVHVAALYDEEDWRQSTRQHFDLVAALQTHNGTAAEQTTRQHIRDALRIILERS